MNLRQYAKGKQCMVRIPGCSGNDEETVLAHYRSSSTGMGAKEPDLLGAWACYNCHMVVDGHAPLPEGMGVGDVRLAFFEGIIRTQRELIQSIIVCW